MIWIIPLLILIFDHVFDHVLAVSWFDKIYTQKGLISTKIKPGVGIVLRSQNNVKCMFITLVGIQRIVIPRTIPKSIFRYKYVLNDQEKKCPYELGPHFTFPKGKIHVYKRIKNSLGGRWEYHSEHSKWPPQ